MTRYATRRLGALVFLAIGISIIDFGILRLIPGDPARAILGTSGGNAALVARLDSQLGLNRPLTSQYFIWLGDIVRGNFGYSYSQKQSVSSLLAQNIPPTLELIVAGLALTVVFGLLIGVIAGLRRGRASDTVLMAGGVGLTARFVRSSVIEAAQQPHVLIARAKGVSRSAVLTRHILRNSLLPV